MLKHPKHPKKVVQCPVCHVLHEASIRNPMNLVRCTNCRAGNFRDEVIAYLRALPADSRAELFALFE